MERRILVKCKVRAHPIVVGGVIRQQMAEVPFPQHLGWLKLLENSEFRRAAGRGHNPYDTAWMWRELKVEDSR